MPNRLPLPKLPAVTGAKRAPSRSPSPAASGHLAVRAVIWPVGPPQRSALSRNLPGSTAFRGSRSPRQVQSSEGLAAPLTRAPPPSSGSHSARNAGALRPRVAACWAGRPEAQAPARGRAGGRRGPSEGAVRRGRSIPTGGVRACRPGGSWRSTSVTAAGSLLCRRGRRGSAVDLGSEPGSPVPGPSAERVHLPSRPVDTHRTRREVSGLRSPRSACGLPSRAPRSGFGEHPEWLQPRAARGRAHEAHSLSQ